MMLRHAQNKAKFYPVLSVSGGKCDCVEETVKLFSSQRMRAVSRDMKSMRPSSFCELFLKGQGPWPTCPHPPIRNYNLSALNLIFVAH